MECGESVEEVMKLPAGEAHQLSGKGGSTLRTVEARSGAQLLVERGEAGAVLRIRGPEAKVKKAGRLLAAMLDFSAEATEEEQGICKSFAAGFCRFGAERCLDGVHSAARAQKAEEAWLKGAVAVAGDPLGGEEPELGRPLLLALGCEIGGGGMGEGGEELVDLAVIAICPRTKREVGRFHRFVRPTYWSSEEEAMRQRFPESSFNTESPSVPFTDVLADLLDWLPGLLNIGIDDLSPNDFLFVGWRDHEVQVLLPRQCNTPSPGTVNELVQNILISRWASLRDVFVLHFSMPVEAAPHNSAVMMKHLALPFQVDQTQRNLAAQSASSTGRILQELLRKGWEAKATAWREAAGAPVTFLLPSRAGEGFRGMLGKRTWAQANGPLDAMQMPPQGHMQPGDFMNLPVSPGMPTPSNAGSCPPPVAGLGAPLQPLAPQLPAPPHLTAPLPMKAPPPSPNLPMQAPPATPGTAAPPVKSAPVAGALTKGLPAAGAFAKMAVPSKGAPAAPPWRQQQTPVVATS